MIYLWHEHVFNTRDKFACITNQWTSSSSEHFSRNDLLCFKKWNQNPRVIKPILEKRISISNIQLTHSLDKLGKKSASFIAWYNCVTNGSYEFEVNYEVIPFILLRSKWSFYSISFKVDDGITVGQWPCQIVKKRCRNHKHKATIEHTLFLIARSALLLNDYNLVTIKKNIKN